MKYTITLVNGEKISLDSNFSISMNVSAITLAKGTWVTPNRFIPYHAILSIEEGEE